MYSDGDRSLCDCIARRCIKVRMYFERRYPIGSLMQTEINGVIDRFVAIDSHIFMYPNL